MLVLSRRAGERILVGDDIEITVVAVRGDQVRLGVSAPREVSVCRSELVERVRCENMAAARSAAGAAVADGGPSSPRTVLGSSLVRARPSRNAATDVLQRGGRAAAVSDGRRLKSSQPSVDIKSSGAASRQSASADSERRRTDR